MPDIIITVVSGETTELGLSIPGVQGPIGGDTMPSGGAAGNILVKQSSINYDATWGTQVSGLTIVSPTLSGSASTGSGFVLGGASDLLAFFGSSAIVQPSGIVIPSGGSSVNEVGAVVSGIVIALQNLGLFGA